MRVELFEQIRRDWRAGGSSIRDVHRRTVRQALASAAPPPRKAYPPRSRPALGTYMQVIDEWLRADRDVPRKQRHTSGGPMLTVVPARATFTTPAISPVAAGLLMSAWGGW